MTERTVVELPDRLPAMAVVLRALEGDPELFAHLGRLHRSVRRCLGQESTRPMMDDHALVRELARLPGLGIHPLPPNLGRSEQENQLLRLLRTCSAWGELEDLVAEFRRRLGAGRELAGRVLAEAADRVEEFARRCRTLPKAIYAVSRAAWGDGEVTLTDLDLTFRSRHLVRFFSSAPRTSELAEFGEGEEGRVAMPPPGRVVLFAATLGGDLEVRSREEMEQGSPFGALVADALGSALAEGVAGDLLDRLVRHPRPGEEDLREGILRRFHLGYGDWRLEEQRLLFAALEPERIGITLGPSCLMTPEKSVAGVAGAKQGSPFRRRRGRGR